MIMEFALKMDYNLMDFLRPLHQDGLMRRKQSPCPISLMTLGTRNEISFSNSPHIDNKEAFTASDVDNLKNQLD